MTLHAENLTFGYGQRLVGEDIGLDLAAGEVLCLLGPNGAGKTTLFKTLLGLIRPSKGTVTIAGRPLERWSGRDRARLMAYVPQAHAATFPFSVLDVTLMGRAARVDLFSAPGERDKAIALGVLETLGIAHLAGRPYTEISGGERQIALIARALAQEPKVLVMDEPTASLDYGNQMRVLSHVRALASGGIAVVLSTHNPDHAFLCADRVALMHDNRLLALGPAGEVLTPDAIERLYGVRVVIGELPSSLAPSCAPHALDRSFSTEEGRDGRPE